MEGVRCPTIIGRAAELATLHGLIDAAARGHGSATFLIGEAGVGKSRLASAVAEHAEAAGLRVLRGRAVDGPHPVTFRPLTEAFLAALRDGSLPDLDGFGPAVERLLPWRSPDAADPSVIAVAEGVLRLLRVLGQGRGCLLVLEDLHWADPETLAVLEYLADHCTGERLALVATIRAEASPAVALATALDARGTARRITLGRLSNVDISAMVRSCLGSLTVPSEVDAFIAGRSDGLPYFVEELLAGLLSSGALVAGDSAWRAVSRLVPAVPLTVTASIRARLDAAPDLPEVLAAAAILGRRFDWSLLADITGKPQSSLLAALRAGTANQLLDADDTGFRFHHALTRDAVLSSLLPPDRTRLAGLAAAALERHHPTLDGDHCELAATLHESAGNTTRAADLLVQAATRATRRGSLRSAEALLTRATDLDHPRAPIALLHVLALGGQTARVFTLGNTLLDATPTPEIHLALARAAISAGDWNRATTHLHAAHPHPPHLSTDPPTPLPTPISAAKLAKRPPPERGRGVGSWAPGDAGARASGDESARASGDRGARAPGGEHARAPEGGVSRVPGDAGARAPGNQNTPTPGDEHAWASGDGGSWASGDEGLWAAGEVAEATVLGAQVAMGWGREGEAAGLAGVALGMAEEWGLAEVACEALEILGRVVRAGDPAAAEGLFERALGIAERNGLSVWRLRAMHELGTIDLVHTGRVDRLEAARGLAVESGALAVLAVIDLHLGDLLSVADRGAEAVAATRRCVELSRRLGLSTLPVGLGHLAGHEASAGRFEAMEGLLGELRQIAPEEPDALVGIPLVYAMYALGQADDGTARARFDEVAEVIERYPTVPFPHRGVWALLHTVYRTPHAEDARRTVRESGALGIRAVSSLMVYTEAVLAGQQGNVEQAVARFEAAERIMDAYQRPRVLKQQTRRLVAIAALEDKWGEPIAWLREALEWAEETNRGRFAADCRARLKEAGAPVPRRRATGGEVPDELRKLGVTARELEVLTLIADGLSNAEIGERLFISPRTVEKHVEKLLARTETRTRGQLAVKAERLRMG